MPCPRTEQQVLHSFSGEYERFPPRQQQIVLHAKKGAIGKVILIRKFQAEWKKIYERVCCDVEQDNAFCSVCKATKGEETQTKVLPHHKQRDNFTSICL